MTINRTNFRGKEIITVDGKVDAFYVNPIKPEHIKTYTGTKGQPWTPTHRYNLIVDGQPISLGMGDKDGVSDRQVIQGKDNDGKYHALVKGLEVSVEVTENGEYQGKTQYQSSNSKVVVIDASGAEAPQKPSGGGSGQTYQAKPKDMSGIEAGQSLNGAMNFILTYGVDASNESIVSYGKKVHSATVKVKESYKKDNPAVPEYDAGARCGLAILTACKLVGTEVDFEQGIIDLAQDILNNVLEPITEFVKTPQASTAPAKVTRAPAKKPAATKAKPVVEEEVFPELDEEDDSSLPF